MNRTAIAIATTLALGCPTSVQVSHAQSDITPTGVQAPVVTVVDAGVDEVIARVSVSGTLVAAEEVLVNTRVNGYAIESISVEIGDLVQAGDVLATLDSSGPKAELAQADAELVRSEAAIGQAQSEIDSAVATRTEARATLERNAKLRESGNISQATLDQAKSAATSAEAEVASARDGLKVGIAQRTAAESLRDLAELTLDRTKIIAPVNGVVAARNAKLGEIASSGGDALFHLIRDGEVEVAVQVVETGLGSIDIGDQAELNVAGVGPVAGIVRLISPTVDPHSRLGIVRVALPHTPSLRPGLSASGWITTDRRKAITVPASAVLIQGRQSFVQLVIDGVVESRPVVAGILSTSGRREILLGLNGGETLLAKAGAFYIDGDSVRTTVSTDANQAKVTQ